MKWGGGEQLGPPSACALGGGFVPGAGCWMGGSRSAARSEEAPQSPEAQRVGARGVPGAEKGHLLSVRRFLLAS